MAEKEAKHKDGQKFANERLLEDAKRKAAEKTGGDAVLRTGSGSGDGVDALTMEQALEACKMKGINVRPGASVEDMQIALSANFEEENLSVREVFDRLDEDESGSLDRDELRKGAAMLGLVVADAVQLLLKKIYFSGENRAKIELK